MDTATIVGFVFGIIVIVTLILMGGSLSLFYDIHAVIVIFGGTAAATIIRFPFSAFIHGFPMGFRYAFTMRSMHPRELIDEITKIADTVRRNGPMALENVQVDDPFLAQGIRYIADGYDATSSATRWSATGTTFSPASRRAPRSSRPWATPPRPGA